MTRTWEISRRTVLRGLGTAIALPWLEAMSSPAASAAGASGGAGSAPHGLLLRAQWRPHPGLDARGGGVELRAARHPRTAGGRSRTTWSS